jgi:hypothetical protein
LQKHKVSKLLPGLDHVASRPPPFSLSFPLLKLFGASKTRGDIADFLSFSHRFIARANNFISLIDLCSAPGSPVYRSPGNEQMEDSHKSHRVCLVFFNFAARFFPFEIQLQILAQQFLIEKSNRRVKMPI